MYILLLVYSDMRTYIVRKHMYPVKSIVFVHKAETLLNPYLFLGASMVLRQFFVPQRHSYSFFSFAV